MANFLKVIVRQLAKVVGLSQSTETESPLQFLQQALRVVKKSGGDPQVVYPFFKNHLKNLNDDLADELHYWATEVLTTARPELKHDIATDIGEFCLLIKDFPLGNRELNIEVAIAGNQVLLSTVFTPENFMEEWVGTQNHLGTAYLNHPGYLKSENIEKAICCFNSVLEKLSCNCSPEGWAMTQNNLGNAYFDRIQGEKAQNLESAIKCWKVASEVFTRDKFPDKWAMTQLNLGNGYANLAKGDPSDNIERAINYYKSALEVYTFKAFPDEDWALCLTNLGNTYTNRLQGRVAENLEEAIQYFTSALEVYKPEEFPEDYANVHSNLAVTYNELGRFYREEQEISENAVKSFKNAIEHCEFALDKYIRDEFPEYWAMTQYNLGMAHYELGLVYRDMHQNYADSLETAIHCCKTALEEYKRELFPYDWANVKNTLGVIYRERFEGHKVENLQEAIRCCQAALEIRIFEQFPKEHAETLFNLGLIYLEVKQFHNAYKVFESAINISESLRYDIISGEAVKRKVAENWHKVYQNMVECCLELASNEVVYYERAIEYVERSKTRNLVELLANKNYYPKRDCYLEQEDYQKVCKEIDQLRGQLSIKQRQLEIARNQQRDQRDFFYEGEIQQQLNQLQENRAKLMEEICKVDPGFKFNQQVESISFQNIRNFLDEGTAIVEWYIMGDQILTFIVTSHPQLPVKFLRFSPDNSEKLATWGNEYLDAYEIDKSQWQTDLPSRLDRLSKILHIDEIIAIVQKICEHCKQLILIPNRFLHLFPLHALPLADGKCLLDKFESVRYAPSCQILHQVKSRPRPDLRQWFAVQNPTNDLSFAELEVGVIRQSYFKDTTELLSNDQATKVAVSEKQRLAQVQGVHFSCHGSFNLQSPLESALLLANDERLTLGDIFELDLAQTRLVVLSACETGMVDPTSTSDEYIGLPAGFLYAGAANVVSSLWKVDDLSTTFLMIKFYENYLNCQSAGVAIALNQAQRWLRDATQQELLDWAKSTLSGDNLKEVEETLDMYNSNEKPYEKPYYWAAFCAVGQ